MRPKLSIIFILCFFWAGGVKPVFALVHTQKNGLFSMDVPEGWRWVEGSEEVIITYPDRKTVAIDIQLVPSIKLTPAEIKKKLKVSGDTMKEEIKAHHGTLVQDKVITLDGVYATQLDFMTASPDPIHVTDISFFNKGYAFSITYGTGDDKMRLVMDDVVATLKFR